MTPPTPKVSVIIPVYNRSAQLKRAIESVLVQTFDSFELVVVDDGSTEDLSECAERVKSHGHRFVQVDHGGVSSARNRGVAESRAAWLAFLDSDDSWMPEKLESQWQLHKDQPELQISQCEELWVRKGRRVNKRLLHAMPEGEAFNQSLALCCISPSSVMLSRELFVESGGFDEDLVACEDYDLWLRITSKHRVGLVSTPLVTKYGGHDDQLSRTVPALDRLRVYSILKLLFTLDLSDTQLEQAVSELGRKLEVLVKGASHRENSKLELLMELERRVRGFGPSSSGQSSVRRELALAWDNRAELLHGFD